MSQSLLAIVLIGIVLYYSLPLIVEERVEGYLLFVFGIIAAYTLEYTVSKIVNRRLCPTCERWMKSVQGLHYCRNCRRFYGKSKAHPTG